MIESKIAVLKKFFGSQPNGRDVTLDELKALTKEDREQLVDLSAAAMGWQKCEGGYAVP